MAYQVLALKWRPSLFEQVVAQEHVTRTLQNAITSKRIANAYLFAGPRGIGKTTTARILAKALNCDKGPTPTPCNKCTNCEEIAAGRSLDVQEIDGASNRGIDEIRNLRENIRYTPSKSKYKIYIVDEVHMLTTEAFNALLKTLEEPPPHVLFIFATTEPHRVPATILSRCQRFDFKRIPIEVIINQLKLICSEEKVEIDDDSLMVIAKKADGSLRDAQSLLDQIISFAGNKIVVDEVLKALGAVNQELYFELTEIVQNKNLQAGLDFVEKIIGQGYDIDEFLLGAVEHFRNLLFVVTTGHTRLIETSETFKARYQQEAQKFTPEDLLRYIKILSETEYAIKRSPNPRLKLEMAIVKILKLDRSVTFEDVISQLRQLQGQQDVITTSPAAEISGNKKTDLFISPAKAKGNGGTVSYNSTHSETSTPVVSQPSTNEETRNEEVVLSLEDIKSNWASIIAEVKKKRIALGFFLQEGVPVGLEGEILEIYFPKKNGFHLNSVDRGKEVIQRVIQTLLGARVKLKLVHSTQKAVDVSLKNQLIDAHDTKSEQPMDPRIKKVLDVFGGELL